MQYRNITEAPQPLQTAEGEITIAPGEIGLTSRKFGNPAVEAGTFELVPADSKPARSTRRHTTEPATEETTD